MANFLLDQHYFETLSHSLSESSLHYPTLVVDLDNLDHNIKTVQDNTKGAFNIRLVAKSLPSVPLLKYIMESIGTNKLMCFHLPFLKQVSLQIPHSDILIGKPLPAAGARDYLQWMAKQDKDSAFDPFDQVQWLVDSKNRLIEYASLAESLNQAIKVNIEINIGLHRGGIENTDELRDCLDYIDQSPFLSFSGLMGYEAHLSKTEGLLGKVFKSQDKSSAAYSGFVQFIAHKGHSLDALCLNTGGSMTYSRYNQDNTLANEIALGSAFLKPTDFDLKSVDQHVPACFIAAPILKRLENPTLPILGTSVSAFLRQLSLLPKRACFIYGGNWLAKPCFPKGSKKVALFGHSSNQEMYGLPSEDLGTEFPYMFFRPTQSEAVLLQFGHIVTYRQGKIIDSWATLIPPSHSFDRQNEPGEPDKC